ncbi:MAG TPA: acyltransferase [Microbacterium sp.]|nr:acyltransferase [Microbacterium sp.]
MIDPFEHSPWDFWSRADDDARRRQRELQRDLEARHPGYAFGDRAFVSELASIDADVLALGDRTYIAAGAYVTGSLRAGRDCSMNPYTVIRGDVTLGDGVRIGAHTSILGFNHSMEPGIEVFRQPLTSSGIRLGDDVWVGSHVVVLDGVTVGDHSVLAAGAIVTKDVPAGAIVGGNPARFIRWRVAPDAADDLRARAQEFGDRARAQALDVLERSWNPELGLFVDRPGAGVTVRAQCDAIELADLLLGTAPPQAPTEVQRRRLRGWQDAASGAVAPLDTDGTQRTDAGWDDPDVAYHVLCVGYALRLLDDDFPAPLGLVANMDAGALVRFCDDLPWDDRAWHSGHWVDALGTALHHAVRRGDPLPDGSVDALFGWLLTHADPATGMWGAGTPDEGLLQPVNGFYRASRGTFAQFGMPLPYPERVIDTVLEHVRDERFFSTANQNACNVLDVAHPLWLTRDTGHRSAEVREVARRLLGDALSFWVDGQGFGFRAPGGEDEDRVPGLQGTEMWLAIIWYLSDLAGLSDALGYRPRGVHRPEPAPTGP